MKIMDDGLSLDTRVFTMDRKNLHSGRKISYPKDIELLAAQTVVCKEGWMELEKLWVPTEPSV